MRGPPFLHALSQYRAAAVVLVAAAAFGGAAYLRRPPPPGSLRQQFRFAWKQAMAYRTFAGDQKGLIDSLVGEPGRRGLDLCAGCPQPRGKRAPLRRPATERPTPPPCNGAPHAAAPQSTA